MPPLKKRTGKKKRQHKKTAKIIPHIEAYAYINNQRLENGKLYNDEKRIIYNPDIAPYPIEQENHYVKENIFPKFGLEKHVQFQPVNHIRYYKPMQPYKIEKREKKDSRKIKDSLLLYRETQQKKQKK